MRGIRARLTVTLVALVALTAVLLGAGAYLFVENGLRDQVLQRRPEPGGVRPVGHRPDARSAGRPDAATTSSTRGPLRVPSARHRGHHRPRPRRCRRLECSLRGRARDAADRPPEPRRGGRAGVCLDDRRRDARASSSAAARWGRAGVLLRPRRDRARGGARAVPARPRGRGAGPRSCSRCSWPGSSPAVSSRRSRRPAGRPSGWNTATCPPGCRSPPMTSSGRGRSASTGWPRRWPTRSPGSRRPRRRTGGSSPMSRMSCGRRSRRWWRRPRSCASTSIRCRPKAGGPASCLSPMSAGCGASSTT